MPVSTRIIVLKTTKVGDRSLVVHALSRELGRRSFITGVGGSAAASGGRASSSAEAGGLARRGGGRASMAYWQPLSVLDAEVVENPKSDLWRLRGVSAVYPLAGLRGDVGRSAVCMFMAEVLYRAVREGAEPELYDWCEKSIVTLDSLEGSYANYHLRWLLELCSAMGFTPALEDLAPFAESHLRDMAALLGPCDEALLLPLTGKARSEIASCLLEYLSAHLEYRLNIRSLAVLGELF